MQLVPPSLFVRESFLDQMPAVGCGINENIFRLLFQPSFYYCFQILILDFKFLKTQVVHINNEFIISVFHLPDYIVQILKLMFIYFNNTQSLIIIFIGNCLDAGRLTCPCISEQQTVIGLPSLHESLRVVGQFFLRQFVPHQIL